MHPMLGPINKRPNEHEQLLPAWPSMEEKRRPINIHAGSKHTKLQRARIFGGLQLKPLSKKPLLFITFDKSNNFWGSDQNSPASIIF